MDDDFEPRIGKMRTSHAPRGRAYLGQVLGAVAIAGGKRAGQKGRFSGARIGRGGAMASLLGSRGSSAAFQARRVVVKTRLVRLGGNGQAAARAHLRYIERDGVAREGTVGTAYGRQDDRASGKDFLERSQGDRHQFRFIVSVEDGAQYDDLRPLVRRWMVQMEADLGTRLDWIAVDHLDTGHPHTHLMLRGKDQRGENLVIAREYIAGGMRERLAELVTLDLGPRTAIEIARTQRRDVFAERVTGLDRAFVREADASGVIAAGHRDPFRHALRAGRLRKLAALGLVKRAGPGRWRLAPGLEEQLRRLGERGDIVRTMQRALGDRATPSALAINPEGGLDRPLVGRVAGRGLADEMRDRQYLIVEATDGRAHYVEVGIGESIEPLVAGAVVRLTPSVAELREADRTIAAIAAAHGGVYSPELHLGHDPSAGAAFAAAHVRRLEAVRRSGAGIEREADGSWQVGDDYLAMAQAYEDRRADRAPVALEVLSPVPFAELAEVEAATWLDRELLADAPVPFRDAGFGREVRAALDARRRWLLSRGLAWEAAGATVYAEDLLPRLRRQDMLRAAQALAGELGLEFAEHGSEHVTGTLARRIDLASGRFALVTRSRDFSLVPWREEMERQLGRELSFTVRGGQSSWRRARQREGPEIG